MTNTALTPAQAAQQNNRDTGGRYAEKVAGEAPAPDVTQTRPWTGAGDGTLTAAPMNVSLQPQAWMGDYAVEAGPAVQFDIAALLHDMDDDARAELVETIGYGDLDQLYFDAVSRGLVEDGYGPFSIMVDEADLNEWLDDNPAWVQDGTTPHPRGGYVSAYRDGDDHVEFRNRDGKLHRLDGPASHLKDTSRAGEVLEETCWSVNGEAHRVDGPAMIRRVVHPNGSSETTLEYWVEGKLIASERTTVDVEAPRPGWVIVDGRTVQQVQP